MKSELEELLDDCSREFSDIKTHIENMAPFDKRVRYLTQYSLMRASGVTEYVYRSVIADYFSKFEDKRIDKFIEKQVRRGSNSSTYANMSDLLGKFDEKWQKDFKKEVSARQNGKKLIAASNSLVSNRHQFAHGRDTIASFGDIQSYYIDVVELIRILDSVISKEIEEKRN